MALPDQFFNAIIAAEGTGKRGNPYDEVLGYGKYGRPSTPVSQLTIAQAIQAGEAVRKNPKNPHNSSAIGAFQITAQNLRTAIREWGFDPNAPFNAQTQKAIAAKIYDQQGLKAWEGFKSHPQAKAVARQAASGATAVASAPPMPTPRPASYDPAQTQSLMAALGVGQQQAPEPVQRVSGLDRFNDPALGFAPAPAPSPAAQAVNAEAMAAIPRPPSAIPNPTPRPAYNANQPVAPTAPPMPTPQDYRFAGGQAGPLPQPPSLPNPTTPSAGNGSISADDFKQAMRNAGRAIGEDPAAVEQVLQRWDQMNAGMPALRQQAAGNLADALTARPAPSGTTAPDWQNVDAWRKSSGVAMGQGGIGSDTARGGSIPSYPMQPRAVATQSITPSQPYVDDVMRAMDGAGGASTAATGGASRAAANFMDPSYWNPISRAEAAPIQPMQPSQAPVGRPANITPQEFDARFKATPDPGANYKALTGAAMPTAAGLGFGLGGVIPTVQPAPQPAPRPAVAMPAYTRQPLTNPARSRMTNIPTVTRQQAQTLAQKIAAVPGGIGSIFQSIGRTLPTMAGPNTSAANTYTQPVSGNSYDVTPGSHGSYMASPSGQIYSPSEYISAMNGSGGLGW